MKGRKIHEIPRNGFKFHEMNKMPWNGGNFSLQFRFSSHVTFRDFPKLVEKYTVIEYWFYLILFEVSIISEILVWDVKCGQQFLFKIGWKNKERWTWNFWGAIFSTNDLISTIFLLFFLLFALFRRSCRLRRRQMSLRD